MASDKIPKGDGKELPPSTVLSPQQYGSAMPGETGQRREDRGFNVTPIGLGVLRRRGFAAPNSNHHLIGLPYSWAQHPNFRRRAGGVLGKIAAAAADESNHRPATALFSGALSN